jgi:hypothetical protein
MKLLLLLLLLVSCAELMQPHRPNVASEVSPRSKSKREFIECIRRLWGDGISEKMAVKACKEAEKASKN